MPPPSTQLPPEFVLAGANSEDAIAQVLGRDKAARGAENISLAPLRSWFATYPDGGLYVWHASRIIAGVGLWPLRKDTYAALRVGVLNEFSIHPDHFAPASRRNPCTHWNLSGFFVENEYRGTTVLPTLLSEAFRLWAGSGAVAAYCRILGIALTDGGVRTMKILGLTQVALGAIGLPRYELRLNLRTGGESEVQKRIAAAYSHRVAPRKSKVPVPRRP